MVEMLRRLQHHTVRALRWTEKYTKTDMVYLASVGWWTNLSFVITSGLAFLLSAAFANLLPRDAYGTYQYLISLSAMLTAICLTGMGGAVTQGVARGYEGDMRSGMRAQLRWSVVPTLLGLAGAVYYAFHGNMPIAIGLAAIALLAPITDALRVYNAFLNGKQDFKRAFIYGNIVNGVYYAAIFSTVFFFKDAVLLVFANLAANALATAFVYFRTIRVYAPNDRTDPHTVSYGTHLSVMNAFGTIITQLDSVLVFHFLGPVQLAIYSLATMIPERLGSAFNFIGLAAFPRFANRSLTELRDTILGKTVRAAALGVAAAAVYAAAAPFLFRYVFPKYIDVISYTQVYSVIIALVAANLVSAALQAKRLKTELYVVSFVNPVMLITLQIPLLLLYGIWGMLWARIISDGVNVVIGIALLYRAARKGESELGA